MKNIIRTFIVISFLSVMPLLSTAQVMGPSDPNGTPQGQPIGGSAPIGGGLFILLGLGAAYGSKKVYELNKKELDD
jgi:hypothetical protein